MENMQAYLDRIRKKYPDLDIKAVEPDLFGQYNLVLRINQDYIFRFPRYEQGVQVLEREAAILDTIKGKVPLAVPDFTFRNFESRTLGEAFVGYRRIEGELFWGETLKSIQDEETIRQLAHQIGGFLHALHNIPVETIPCELPLSGKREEWTALYRDFRELLYPFMRPDAQQWTTAHFEAFLDDPGLHTFEPCLVHGDYGPGNVLFDRQARSVCGVIDFGFAGLGDPAQDVAAASCFGESYLQHYASVYPGIEQFLPRARFIKGTFALYEALHGVKNNDRAAFEAGIAQYK